MKRNDRKSMGQHFLTNPYTLNKIIDCIAPQKKELIIEIGAGKGSLTRLLAEKAGRVIALEKDASLIPYLEKNKPSNLEIRQEDVLETDFSSLAKQEKTKLAGNLPFSISSQILFKLLEEHDMTRECHFMLQKEVAERVCASPGSKKYAPLSILLQNIFSAKIRFLLSPGSFTPPPKVRSAFITLKKRTAPLYPFMNTDGFKSFIKQAFSQRRKKLKNSLKPMGFAPEQMKESFRKCGLDPNIRAEKVSIDDFACLYLNLTEA
ncbi:MAG: ribosomal RNA small subunit methyltransferase A [Candidatus Aminicenantes bacterium]|nr:ribosomal RNA small subunit methyltransferase A [Candidatus Aminicenantes bacterium]